MHGDARTEINKKCDDIIHQIESIKDIINSDINIDAINLVTSKIRSITYMGDWFDNELARLVRSEIIHVASSAVSHNIITDRLPQYTDLIDLDYVGPLSFIQVHYDDGCKDLAMNCRMPRITPERTLNFVHDQRIANYLSSLWNTEINATTSTSIKYYPGDVILYIIPKDDKFDSAWYVVNTLSKRMTYQLVPLGDPYEDTPSDHRFCNLETSLKALSMYQKLAKTKMPESRYETFKKEVQN